MRYILENGLAVFDCRTDRLTNAQGTTICLRHPQALLLTCLIEGVTDKRLIVKRIWPHTIVAEGSYHKLIHHLRSRLAEIGLDPALIKTIPRRGYVFIGHAELSGSTADTLLPRPVRASTTTVSVGAAPPGATKTEVAHTGIAWRSYPTALISIVIVLLLLLVGTTLIWLKNTAPPVKATLEVHNYVGSPDLHPPTASALIALS